jgi:hypothetical protein
MSRARLHQGSVSPRKTGNALLEEEPLFPVTLNGVRFDLSDIRALLIDTYDVTASVTLGDRCKNDFDANVRIDDLWCRDVNPGTFHLVVSNYLGRYKLPLGEDRVNGKEVWNQPVYAYNSSVKPVSRDEALSLLPSGTTDKVFDAKAVKFYKVQTALSYVFESEELPSRSQTVPRVASEYTKRDTAASDNVDSSPRRLAAASSGKQTSPHEARA